MGMYIYREREYPGETSSFIFCALAQASLTPQKFFVKPNSPEGFLKGFGSCNACCSQQSSCR